MLVTITSGNEDGTRKVSAGGNSRTTPMVTILWYVCQKSWVPESNRNYLVTHVTKEANYLLIAQVEVYGSCVQLETTNTELSSVCRNSK